MARGMLWILLEKVGQQLLTFAVFFILALLIGPEEFGLAGLCGIVAAFASFVVFGSADAVISRRITDSSELSTLFWTILMFGILISLATFFGADLLAGVFDEPRLAGMLRALSPLATIFAASSVPTVLVKARMEFRTFMIRSTVSTALGGITGISLALNGYGAYAIIYQQLMQGVVALVILWPAAKWRPRFQFRVTRLAFVMAPGIKMTGSNFITFLEQQVPRFAVGAWLGAVHVGFYTLANRLFQSLLSIIVMPITTVLYPALSKINDQPERMRWVLRQNIYLAGLLACPAITGAALLGPDFVHAFLGEKWAPAAPVLRIFLVAMAPAPFLLVIREALRSINRAGLFIKIQLLITGLILTAILILAPKGLVAMCWGMAAVSFSMFPVALWWVSRSTDFNLIGDFARLWGPLLASAAMVGAIEFAQRAWFGPFPDWAKLSLSVVVGGAVYVGICIVLNFGQIRSILKMQRQLKANGKSADADGEELS